MTLQKKICFAFFFLLANNGAIWAVYDFASTLSTIEECLAGRVAILARLCAYSSAITSVFGIALIWTWALSHRRPWDGGHPLVFSADFTTEQVFGLFFKNLGTYWMHWNLAVRLLFLVALGLFLSLATLYLYLGKRLSTCTLQDLSSITSALLVIISGACLWWFFGSSHEKVFGHKSISANS
jgi:hypothetical protein